MTALINYKCYYVIRHRVETKNHMKLHEINHSCGLKYSQECYFPLRISSVDVTNSKFYFLSSMYLGPQ